MRKISSYARKRGLMALPTFLRGVATKARKGDGLRANNLHNTPFTADELATLMREPRQAQEAMRTGRGTYNDLVTLSSVWHKGVAIEDARTIIRGFAPIYNEAHAALKAIEARCTATPGRWTTTALYSTELRTIEDMLWAYEQALKTCTYHEFYACQRVAIARAATAGQKIYTVGDVVEYQATQAPQATHQKPPSEPAAS